MNITTDYPLEVITKMKEAKKSMPKDAFLREHQYLFLKYFTEISIFKRGILAFHGTGTGKTITAEAVVDFYRKNEPERDIVLLMSKSLTSNFKETAKKFMSMNPYAEPEEKSEEYINSVIKKFKFITLGSSNMYTQFEKINDDEYDDMLSGFLSSEKVLENKILVIDEVHNLANSIANGSKNGIKLYDLIMNTKNVRLIFLTATPMINSPFELVPLMNMLRGRIDGYTILPENYGDFAEMFIKDGKVHNKQKLMNRLYGLVSYYGSEYFKKDMKDFPEQKQTILEKVPMSEYQFSQYENMRALERKEESNKFRKSAATERFADKSGASSSYRVKSRQISNFAYPEDAFTLINGKFRKFPEKVTDKDLKQLSKYSPKISRLLKNLNGKGPDVVYSQFLPWHMQRILMLNGYELWKINETATKHESDEDEPIGDFIIPKKGRGKKMPKFAIISGEVSADIRAEIIKSWNSAENKYGEVIKILIITSTGAEGLDLKYGRRIHILEPFWNMARIEQVIARIVRFRSHADLPATDRNVQPYIYMSTYPENYPKSKIKELATDEDIYENAVRAKSLINEFIKVLIEVSIDCEALITPHAREKYKCMVCNPTHAILYHPDIYIDRKLPNRCMHLEEKKKKVHEIAIPETGEKYYYSNDGEIKLYRFDEHLNGYIPLEKDNPIYVDLTRQIMLKK